MLGAMGIDALFGDFIKLADFPRPVLFAVAVSPRAICESRQSPK
jgi:hypothetical protein